MKLNKTLLAVIIASTTSAAYADLNKAIDLVDGLTHKSISFDEGHSEWQNMDSETQREAHQYDHAQGTHFTSDYREGEHTEYARGEATATYHEAAQSDVKPVYSGESHRPAMTTTQDDLASAHSARTVNQHVDYNAQVVAAHDIEAAKVKGKLLTDANIARTANQRVDYNAQVVAAHDIEAAKVKGKLLTDANIARTANQRVDYNAQVVATHDIEAARVKGKLLTDANIARTANQRVDYNAQVVETHDVEAARVKGKLLTNANIARTADQHTTQSALTHATATATPDIDRTQHLDSNATGQDRQTAKLNAVTEQSQVNADAVKGLQLVQANQQRTASQHVTEEPHNGIDGKTGAQGEKGDAGVTTTITKVQTDTATQTQVAQNRTTLRHVQEEQTAQGEYVQHMNQTVSHTATLAASNSQRLNAVESHQKSLEQQQSNDREEYRAGIAGAVAISGLHYTETDNSVAIGAGDFKNEQGYALGYRHKFSDNVATTVAASETSNGDAMFSASAAIGW